MTAELSGRVILVTGASRGIGREVALEAGRRGAHVIASARTVGGLEELDDAIQAAGGATTLVPLDLKDFDGIDRLGKAIFDRWGHLDGLVGNAGVLGTISPLAHVEPREFEQSLSVNVTANFRLIRSMDLLLRQAEAGRAVFLSSGVVRRLPPFWGPYSAAKAALEALAATYAAETASTRVRVNVLNPGPLRTAMRARAHPGEDPMTLQPPEAVAPLIVDMVSPGYAETGVLVDFPSGQTRPLAFRVGQ